MINVWWFCLKPSSNKLFIEIEAFNYGKHSLIAFLFPGQGSQFIGMGKDIAKEFAVSKDVFDEVDNTLGFSLSDLIWTGDKDSLTLTKNAQPAIMATSMAVLAALKSEGLDISKVLYLAGHSLGEYSALCAAGSLTLADTAKLLQKRGQFMQESVPIGTGSMAAIIGLDIKTATDITEECKNYGFCEVANDNDPTQVVISGEKVTIEKACELAKSKGAKRAIILPVSAPFHCSLMTPAQEKMAEVLRDTSIVKPIIPIISNITASALSDPTQIRKNLVKQITGTVRWRESMIEMRRLGVESFLEIGPGKVLSNLVKRIVKGVDQFSLGTSDELNKFMEQSNV